MKVSEKFTYSIIMQTNEKYSTLLQLFHQLLISSETHNRAQEKLLSYFQQAGCDNKQLDILRNCFSKATLDCVAFTGRNEEHINPDEFSQRLASELTKKYKDTRDIQQRLTRIDDICKTEISEKISIRDAIDQFSDIRLSAHNLEGAMITLCESDVRSKVGRMKRHSAAYDEQILTFRKKLSVSISFLALYFVSFCMFMHIVACHRTGSWFGGQRELLAY